MSNCFKYENNEFIPFILSENYYIDFFDITDADDIFYYGKKGEEDFLIIYKNYFFHNTIKYCTEEYATQIEKFKIFINNLIRQKKLEKICNY